MVGSEEFEPTTAEAAEQEQAAVADQQPAGETVTGETVTGQPGSGEAGSGEAGWGEAGSGVHPDTVLAAERLTDLQRLQAEYVNYKRRVDRDRAVVQERAVRDVLETLLPVLDDISGAREHGDLTDGPFAKIADKLESTLGRFGLERYGVSSSRAAGDSTRGSRGACEGRQADSGDRGERQVSRTCRRRSPRSPARSGW